MKPKRQTPNPRRAFALLASVCLIAGAVFTGLVLVDYPVTTALSAWALVSLSFAWTHRHYDYYVAAVVLLVVATALSFTMVSQWSYYLAAPVIAFELLVVIFSMPLFWNTLGFLIRWETWWVNAPMTRSGDGSQRTIWPTWDQTDSGTKVKQPKMRRRGRD